MATEHFIPLSLTEDYCPSWGTWEGVRELVQNFHDGCLHGDGGQPLSWRRDDDAMGGALVALRTHNNSGRRPSAGSTKYSRRPPPKRPQILMGKPCAFA